MKKKALLVALAVLAGMLYTQQAFAAATTYTSCDGWLGEWTFDFGAGGSTEVVINDAKEGGTVGGNNYKCWVGGRRKDNMKFVTIVRGLDNGTTPGLTTIGSIAFYDDCRKIANIAGKNSSTADLGLGATMTPDYTSPTAFTTSNSGTAGLTGGTKKTNYGGRFDFAGNKWRFTFNAAMDTAPGDAWGPGITGELDVVFDNYTQIKYYYIPDTAMPGFITFPWWINGTRSDGKLVTVFQYQIATDLDWGTVEGSKKVYYVERKVDGAQYDGYAYGPYSSKTADEAFLNDTYNAWSFLDNNTATFSTKTNTYGLYSARKVCADMDHDLYYTGEDCTGMPHYPAVDCNDSDNLTNPGAPDTTCDAKDQNCDGNFDEGYAGPKSTYYRDADTDGYGAGSPVTVCTANPPAGYVANSSDCNDSNVAFWYYTYYRDDDGDGFGTSVASTNCSATPPAGYAAISGDCDDTTVVYADNDGDGFGYGSAVTNCVGTGFVANNDDCDDTNVVYADNDGDGFGYGSAVTNCVGTGFVANNSDCDDTNVVYYDGDDDGYGAGSPVTNCVAQYYVTTTGDCADDNASINPASTEICNQKDDDCDTFVDEGWGNPITYYRDADGDKYGNAANAVPSTDCAPPIIGYVTDNTDCDDTDILINPKAQERCNGKDDDCNGVLDDNATNPLPQHIFYRDADHDGYGNEAITIQACAAPDNYTDNKTTGIFDCKDNNSAINPGATELCNGIDDNCIDGIDEGFSLGVACDGPDADLCNEGVTVCLDNGTGVRCTDATGDNVETCNELDDDCDGTTDEGVQNTYYQDYDNDGYGNLAVTTLACTRPVGYRNNTTDCNDADNRTYPGATELCNEIDDNCNGQTDEFLIITYYLDADGDGYGTGTASTGCSVPAGYASASGDCDDANAKVNPGAFEITGNGIDDDCNGLQDENAPGSCEYWKGKWAFTYKTKTDNVTITDICSDPDAGTEGNTPPACMTNSFSTCEAKGTRASDGKEITIGQVYMDKRIYAYYETWELGSTTPFDAVHYRDFVDEAAYKANPFGYKGGYKTMMPDIINDCDFVAAIDGSFKIYTQAQPNGVDYANIFGLVSGERLGVVCPIDNETCVDKDGDGYGDNCTKGSDCNDNDSSINPGAAEICNGKDDDCNGIIDTDNASCIDTDITCVLRVVPKQIFKLFAFLNPFIPFVISAESDSGVVFARPFDIDWGTDAINDILRIKIGKRIIVGFMFARPLQLESDNYTVTVTYGDNETEECGKIEVK